MARIKTRPVALSEIAAPSLTAATSTYTVEQRGRRVTPASSDWSKTAWDFYDSVGELRFVCQWLSNSLSRVTLMAADVDKSGKPSGVTEDDIASRIVSDIAGGPAGQAQLLARLATFLTVPGEGWVAVISRPNKDGVMTEEWHVLSTDEVSSRGAGVLLELDDGTEHEFDPERDILTRVYRPHPRRSREADSPVRSALPILAEIKRTTETIDGASKSRLAGNGILLLPQEISMPTQEPPRANRDAPGLESDTPRPVDRQVSAADLMQRLQEVMTTAVRDHTSAAAMVPIVLKAPGDMLDKIKHLRFESEITDTALKTRESAIMRLARTLDVPQEVLMGMGASNHWSAWQVDESAIKTHIQPMMTLICDALTESILRPLLRAVGHPAPESVTVWFDSTGLTQRPDRSGDAQAAYDAGAINADAYRRELGFTEDDAPNIDMSEQEQRSLAQQMVARAPSLLPQLAHILGLDPPPGGWSQSPGVSAAPAVDVGPDGPPERGE